MTPHRARHLTTIPDLADLNAPCEHKPVVIDRPVVLYGKGELGKMAHDYLAAIGVVEAGWVDSGNVEMVHEPLRPEMLTLIAIAKHPYVPIEQGLMARGFTNVAPFLDVTPNHPEHPLANGWFADPLDIDKVQAVLDMFDDDVSRAHYVQFLAWRRLREEWTFEGAPVDVHGPRYWPYEVASVLNQGAEVFIDGGSYDGKVSEAFEYRFGGNAMPIDAAHQRGAPWYSIRCVLTDADGPVPFVSDYGYANRVRPPLSDIHAKSGTGTTLDSLIPGVIPTFVKLHLEGHELPVLRGAVKTIETHRPILAVTTYHNDDGIDRIPAFMRDHCSDCRFLWRNSAYVGEGAVAFAIPSERAC